MLVRCLLTRRATGEKQASRTDLVPEAGGHPHAAGEPAGGADERRVADVQLEGLAFL